MRSTLLGLALSTLLVACGDGQPAGDDGTDVVVSDAAAADAAPACDPGVYPLSMVPTAAERAAQAEAVTAFEAATGATVELDPLGAVTGISGGTVAVVLDPALDEGCPRALAALADWFAANATMFVLPADLTARACSYDDLTDAEIIRLSGGTYDGRALIASPNDLLVHVKRTGAVTFWAGGYVPARVRPQPTACFAGDQLEAAVVGASLAYQEFAACVLGDTGAIDVAVDDDRLAGAPAAYVDDGGALHLAREVEVSLDPARITDHEINSDLFCCSGKTLDGCVGAILVVDELTGAVLAQLPRCHTC